MPGGIRTRITAAAIVAIVAVLVVSGMLVLHRQRTVLTDTLDELLQSRAEPIVNLTITNRMTNPISGQGDAEAIAQIIDAHGHVVASTENLAGRPPVAAAPKGRQESRTIPFPRHRGTLRLFSARVNGFVIHTGAPVDDVDDSVTTLRNSLLVAVPPAALALGLLVWWLVGRTLRPVAELRSAAADISGSNLQRRVPEPGTSDEIGRLARTFNNMLDRLEDSARRQREFVADASHELRSPLTRVRTELEVDLHHPETADLTATHRSVLQEVETLQLLVEDLLTLARFDESDFATSETIDVANIGRDIAERVSAPKPVHVEMLIDTLPIWVAGVEREIGRVLLNLLENAIGHASARVRFGVSSNGINAVISVEDDGPGIAAGDRVRIFDRFVRLDTARHQGDGGSGLGLAIVAEIVHRHRGEIDVGTSEMGGAALRVRLPIAR